MVTRVMWVLGNISALPLVRIHVTSFRSLMDVPLRAALYMQIVNNRVASKGRDKYCVTLWSPLVERALCGRRRLQNARTRGTPNDSDPCGNKKLDLVSWVSVCEMPLSTGMTVNSTSSFRYGRRLLQVYTVGASQDNPAKPKIQSSFFLEPSLLSCWHRGCFRGYNERGV
jgi:hypothetical protein